MGDINWINRFIKFVGMDNKNIYVKVSELYTEVSEERPEVSTVTLQK